MNPKKNFLLAIFYQWLLVWLAVATVKSASGEVQSHPLIVKQPQATEILFQVADGEKEADKPFMIECEADGNPPPFYTWLKNGHEFNWHKHSDRIFQRPDFGTLIFTSPRDEDVGLYECLAKNKFGVAASNPIQVRKVETDLPVVEKVAELKHEAVEKHIDGSLKKNVEGILARTKFSGPLVIPFNSTEVKSLSSGNIVPLVRGKAFDWNSSKIYWQQSGIGIVRSNLDGSEYEILQLDPSSYLSTIAIEPISGNLYVRVWSSGAIRVCNNDATKCSTIKASSTEYVYDIAIDQSKGLLFYSILRKHLVRANLDGSNATIILKMCSIRGLDVDEHEGRIYFASDLGIGSCDHNGNNLWISYVDAYAEDVAVDEDSVYSSSQLYWNLNVTSKLGTKFGTRLGTSSSLVKRLDNFPFWDIALFGTRSSNQPTNPCEKSECEHLCVLKSSSSYRCMCADNEELNPDGKTCTRLTLNNVTTVADIDWKAHRKEFEGCCFSALAFKPFTFYDLFSN